MSPWMLKDDSNNAFTIRAFGNFVSSSLWPNETHAHEVHISAVGTSSVLQSKAQGLSIRRSGGKVH
jgi:hypothetical protein